MQSNENQIIVVTGATGLQGSHVTRHLLADGWQVKALTRNAGSQKAQVLAASGAEVVQADMSVPETLQPVFEGAYGVFSVQNPMISGFEGEIQQGKHLAEAARRAGVQHVVYGSAGVGTRGTGVPSWETKLVIEDTMRSLDLPLTVLRPMAFMELMTDAKFYPAVSTWNIMPALMGSTRKVVWLCADDFGYIAAQVFSDPGRFIGQELRLASDIQSIDECRAIYAQIAGRKPPRFPMPVWMFKRFGYAGKDLPVMWTWLRDAQFEMDTTTARSIHPGALSVREWLEKQLL